MSTKEENQFVLNYTFNTPLDCAQIVKGCHC